MNSLLDCSLRSDNGIAWVPRASVSFSQAGTGSGCGLGNPLAGRELTPRSRATDSRVKSL
jgi:hypothetical protein